ncbi:hypothetical protein [Tumebacillus flagellatus]|uniref:Uncharacterized protein n=1 Tax=Tumebacillus flagellatus TaxID=1157490 RepID=A0A074ME73_9BACL|nr:hypothetical protein [Tumebacillus flagellatus]KEO84097.1 hypothetical protein EL26_06435 [Tumebacillus flagellatus]
MRASSSAVVITRNCHFKSSEDKRYGRASEITSQPANVVCGATEGFPVMVARSNGEVVVTAAFEAGKEHRNNNPA